jgi:predicted MFS family arabinose efflux permease
MVAGGLLTAMDWRWVFFAPVLLSAAILVAAIRLIPDDGRPERAAGFDLAGALTVTGGMLLLVFAVVQSAERAAGATAAVAAAGLALLAAFVAIEHRAAAPLLRLGLLRSAPLVRANAGIMLFIGSFVAFQFIAVLYMQELRGWTALETGLALTIIGLDAILAPTVTPRLIERFGTARIVLDGMLLAAAGYALFLPLGPDWTYAAMLPTFLLIAVAFSLAYGALTIAATDGVDDADQGVAGGLISMSLQFGAAVGLAIATAVNVGATGDAGALLDGYRAALLVPVVAALLGVAVSLPGLRRTPELAATSRA